MKQPASRRNLYPWAIVGMLWFICFFNYADRVAISSVFPLLQKQYHFSKSQLGLIGAAFTWVYAAFAPFAGDVGDRLPRKWVIIGGLYIWSIVTGFTSVCSRLWQFVFVRGAEGLGETFYFPASMALISDYHAGRTRSRAIGLHQTSIYAGTIFGGTVAGLLAEKHGWQTPFWCFAAAGVLLGLILSRFIKEPALNQAEAALRDEDSEPPAERRGTAIDFLGEVFKTPTAVLLLAAYCGANLVGFVFLTWMPTFLKEKFHINLAAAGFGATFFIQTASMVGAAIGGVLADGRAIKRKQGRIEVQAAAILLGAPFVFLCGWTRSAAYLILAMSLFGLCKGIYDASLTAAYYDVLRPARRGTATGIMNCVGWIAAGIGAVSVGAAVDRGATMSAAIASMGLVYLFVGLVLWYTSATTAVADITRNTQRK